MQVHPVALQWVAPMQGEGEEKEWFRPMRDFSDPMIGVLRLFGMCQQRSFLGSIVAVGGTCTGARAKVSKHRWIRLAVMGGNGYSERMVQLPLSLTSFF